MIRPHKVCSANGWCAGGMNTMGEPEWICQPFRVVTRANGRTEHVHGDQYGRTTYSNEEMRDVEFLHGYTKLYGRNTMEFTQSRAARKRGYPARQDHYNRDVHCYRWREWDVQFSGLPGVLVRATSRHHAMRRARQRLTEEGYAVSDDTYWNPQGIKDIELHRGVRSY